MNGGLDLARRHQRVELLDVAAEPVELRGRLVAVAADLGRADQAGDRHYTTLEFQDLRERAWLHIILSAASTPFGIPPLMHLEVCTKAAHPPRNPLIGILRCCSGSVKQLSIFGI